MPQVIGIMVMQYACLLLLCVGLSRGQEGRLCPEGTNVTGTVKVTGQANRFIQPDMSKLRLAVKAIADTSAEATDLGNALIANVSQSLSGLVNATDIQTSNFQLTPNYPVAEDGYTRMSSIPDNFTYFQSLDVTTTPDVVGSLVDVAIESGGDRVQIADVVFYASNEKTKDVLNELRVEAIKNGLETATIMVTAGGGEIGGVVLLSDSSYVPYVPPLSTSIDGMATADSAAAPEKSVIYAGELDISASVFLESEICM